MENQGIRTVCGFCHTGCGVVVFPEGKGIGEVTGDRDHPVNQGALCPKGKAIPELLTSPERLTMPLIKTSSGFRPISWDEALSFMAEKLEELKTKYGPQNLVRFRGAPISDTVRDAFHQFSAVYGSSNSCGVSHLCSVPERMGFQSIFGDRADPDFEGTKLVLLWGANPQDSHSYGDIRPQGLYPLKKCKKEGARIIAIDPRKSETAREAHLWIPIQPRSDAALALAMAKVIVDENLYDKKFIEDYTLGFEEFRAHLESFTPSWAQEKTGISATQIKDLAFEFATTKPALILAGNGLNMHPNVVQTTRALAALIALTGNLDIPGGNVFFPKVPQAPCPSVKVSSPEIGKMEYPLYPFTSFPSVIDALSHPSPIQPRAMIVYHGNPALVNANEEKVFRALASLELLVVIDLFMTRTAKMAHLVLPDTSAYETWGYRVYPFKQGAFVTLCRPVMKPIGMSRPGLEVEWELASRMGLEEYYPWNDTIGWIDYKLKPSGVSFEALKQKHLIYVTPPLRYQKYKDEGFATPSGKIEFFSEKFQKLGYSPLPAYQELSENTNSDYPLLGTTRRPGAYVHTQFRNLLSLRKREPDARLRIHPQDALPRQIREGDEVRVVSPRGTIHLKATLVEEVNPGLVVTDFGWGNPGDGWENVNRLAGDLPRDSISSTTPNREFICQVMRSEG